MVAFSLLVDEAVTKSGDLYIRSVCFSPDGKYLATGAEDKQIRVSTLLSQVLSFQKLTASAATRFGISQSARL